MAKFEKEAEEYQTEKRKTFNEHEQLCWGDVYKDWKNGAEFGYNKGLKSKIRWHKGDEIQAYEDIPQDKDKLYVWKVDERKYEKNRPIIKTKVGTQDELEYDIMAYHLIAWCELPKFEEVER